MNVASLALCRELYELSGWGNGFKDLSELSAYWRAGKFVDNPTVHRYAPDVLLGEFYGRMLFTVPAYDLGYLLRKLPPCLLKKSADGWYRAEWWSEELLKANAKEDTPEDAAAKLCIELFKQGLLTGEDKDNE